MEYSDWLVYGWDFTVQTITMEMVSFHVLSSAARKYMLSETQKGF